MKMHEIQDQVRQQVKYTMDQYSRAKYYTDMDEKQVKRSLGLAFETIYFDLYRKVEQIQADYIKTHNKSMPMKEYNDLWVELQTKAIRDISLISAVSLNDIQS